MEIKVQELKHDVMGHVDIIRSPEISRQGLEHIRRIIKEGRDNILKTLLLVAIAAAGAGCEKKEALQEAGREGRVLERVRNQNSSDARNSVDAVNSSLEIASPLPGPVNPVAKNQKTGSPEAETIVPSQQKYLHPVKTSHASGQQTKPKLKTQREALFAPLASTAKKTVKFKIYSIRRQNEGHYELYYVDENGENIFGETTFENAAPFKEGIALIKKRSWDIEGYPKEKPYYINKNGENAFGDKKFEEATTFSEGFAAVRENEKWYYVNKKGMNAFGAKEFNGAEPFSKGLAIVCDGEGYYYINKNGENAFGDRKFYDAKPFNEGLAIVREGEKYYYINENGANVFGEKKFSRADPFRGGFAKVVEGIRPYTIDKTGEEIKKSDIKPR